MPPLRLISLDEYVSQGVLSAAGHVLSKRIKVQQRNVTVAGPTESSKTTFCNTILAEITPSLPRTDY